MYVRFHRIYLKNANDIINSCSKALIVHRLHDQISKYYCRATGNMDTFAVAGDSEQSIAENVYKVLLTICISYLETMTRQFII